MHFFDILAKDQNKSSANLKKIKINIGHLLKTAFTENTVYVEWWFPNPRQLLRAITHTPCIKPNNNIS
jgi:hypothetical protein